MEPRFRTDTDNLFLSGLDKSGVNIVKEAKEKFAAKAIRQIILETLSGLPWYWRTKVTSLFRRNILSFSPFLLYTPKNTYDIESYFPLRNFLYLITSL